MDKGHANKAMKEEEVKTKIKFCYPQHSMTIEAESQEKADAELADYLASKQ